MNRQRWRLIFSRVLPLLATALLAKGCAAGPVAVMPADVLDDEESAWLASQDRTFVVAPDPRWYPDSGSGEPEPYSGLEADFLELLQDKLALRFATLRTDSWEDLLAKAGRGEVDIFPAVRTTADNEERWLLTQPYMSIPVVLLVRKTLEGSLTHEMLRMMKIGVSRKYGIREFVDTTYPGLNVFDPKSDLDGLLDVAVGDLDLMIIDQSTASYYIEKQSLTNLRIAGRIGPAYEFSIAVPKDRPMLFRVLSKGLSLITPEERQAMLRKRLQLEARPFYRSRLFWYWFSGMSVVFLVVLLTILIWNKTLKRQIMERKKAEREVLEISSFERRRIGHDLHDGLGQQLAGIACLSQLLAKRLAAECSEHASAADRVAALAEGAIKHAKFIVRGLVPVDVLQEGLRVALLRLAAETEEISGVTCRWLCKEPSPVYDNDVATNLYRIAQEAVTNAVKHGKAKSVCIGLSTADGSGSLVVEDDGVGFDASAIVGNEKGVGLRTMRYRAEMCGGSFRIEPRPEGGMRVICSFVDRGVNDGGVANG